MTFSLLLASAHAMASGQAITTADQAADRAAEVTQSHHLSSNRTQCLLFDVSDKKRYFMVRVHEKHTPECGGDPATAPVLFFLKIRKRDGYVLTNQRDGEHFAPLPPKP
ncbi:putative lipoprotein [Burkholderia sp. H160]|nr:putative lipoprotein [Burkholderia sp. H160]